MTNKLNLNKITKALMEDMPQATFPKEYDKAEPLRIKGSASGAMEKQSYDKLPKRSRSKPSVPKKAGQRNPSKNSGPVAAPKSGNIKGSNSMKKGSDKVSAPDMKIKSVANPNSPIVDAKDIKRSEASAVKWVSAAGSSTDKLIGSVLKGLTQDKVKKITFNVSKPSNVNYGIVPTGEKFAASQSHKMKTVGNAPKVVKEGVINGTTTVTIGKRNHVFEAASVEMIKNMVRNYAEVGQEVSVDVKVGLREAYADKRFVTALIESIHAKTLDIDTVFNAKIQEAYDRFKKLIDDQFIPFHNRSRANWVNECVKPAFKQAYGDFKTIYESNLQPYEVTMKVHTRDGMEMINVVSRALNENVAIHSAVEEISAELGPKARFEYGYIGSKRYVAEDADSLLSKALSFDDMPDGFKDAGFGYKDTKRIDPKAPKVDKQKPFSKKRDLGATTYKPKAAPGKNAEKSVDRKGADKRDKTTRARATPKKDTGPRWAD